MYEWTDPHGYMAVSTDEDELVRVSVPPNGITAEEALELSSALVDATRYLHATEAA